VFCSEAGVQLAGALPPSGGASRCEQILGDGSTADVEMTRDLAHRPVLGEVEAMNGVDLFGREHVAEGDIEAFGAQS